MEEDKNRNRTYVDGNNFYIEGVVNETMLNEIKPALIKKISELKAMKDAKITFWVTTGGGYAFVEADIVELMELAKKNGIVVQTVITSKAYSAGSAIAVAGTKGERYIAESAEHLIHLGTFGGDTYQTYEQLNRNNEQLQRYLDNIIKHYNKYCKVPKLKEKLKDDLFFIPAEDCIKWEIADKLMSEFNL